MNANNDDLDLQSLWQDTAAPDVEKLLAAVRRSRTRMWQMLALELVGTVAGIVALAIYCVWGVFGERLLPAVALGALAVGVQIWMWRWRKGLWRALSDAPLDLLRLQRKRTRVNLKIARYYAWGTPISVVLGFGFALLTVDSSFSTGLSTGARIVFLIALVGLMTLFTVYGFRMISRCKRELAELDTRIAQFEDRVDQ